MNNSEAIDQGKEIAEDKMGEYQAKFKQGKEALKRYGTQAKDKASEYAKQAKEKTEEQIHAKPFSSMLMVLGVGVGLGLLAGMAFGGRRSED